MYDYISGHISSINPASVVIDCNGIGFHIHISLHTFTGIQGKSQAKLFTHFHVKEDQHALYGFTEEAERTIFLHLISVSGIGPGTARMMLSSLSPHETVAAIRAGDADRLQRIKGVGPKSAQRIILELKDKVSREPSLKTIPAGADNTFREEALSALVSLGLSRINAEKAVGRAMEENPDINSADSLVKQSLRLL